MACSIAAGFAAILRWHAELPTAIVVAALAILAAWYNSLQHEVIHGHPTPWPAINTALASLPVGIVVPYSWYRTTHLTHHREAHLTDPDLDPESFYVSPAVWDSYGPVGHATLRAMRTLLGRMVLGPPLLTARLIAAGWSALRARPVATALRVVRHAAGVAAVLAIVVVSGLPVWVYLLGAVWLGWSISLVRSFVEHRFVEGGNRSAVVHAGPAMSVLFLNNNLHLTHHAQPGVAWYELPAVHASVDADIAAEQGAGVYTSYLDVVRQYAVRPFCQVVHPSGGATAGAAGGTDDQPAAPIVAPSARAAGSWR
ncbi:MAG: fatty acid desaturase [Ilumatobacteraceae bacterium]